jgi:hypothetical protein
MKWSNTTPSSSLCGVSVVIVMLMVMATVMVAFCFVHYAWYFVSV